MSDNMNSQRNPLEVDMNVFHMFIEQIGHLGERVAPSEIAPEDQVRIAKDVFREKLDRRKATYLESCVHCGMCAEACHFYVSTEDPKYTPIRKLDLLKRFYRRELSPMRWAYRFTEADISAAELLEWQELVYDSCTECGRCGVMCPMGIDIASMVNVMRQGLAKAGLIPDDLRAVEQEQCAAGTVFGAGPDHLRQAVDQLRQMGLEVPLDKERADVMVLTSVIDIMLFHDALAGTVNIMNHLGVDWTFRSHAFEGANFGLLSGYEDLQQAASNRIVAEAIACGAKTVIVPECGHAYPALRWEGADEFGDPLPFEVLAVSEFIGREVAAGRLKLKSIGKDQKFTYHDPCKLARHGGIIEEPRAVLNALGVDMRETPSHGNMNWCCGGGAGVFVINRAKDLRQGAFDIKMTEVDATGADTVVMSCGSCRLNFMRGKENAGWDKNIKSLVALACENLA